jgi:Ca2+-binding EF-hand superfamily protein
MESWSQLDFDKLDLDGDGVVSKEELATALACPA